jgi:hypothetical protein
MLLKVRDGHITDVTLIVCVSRAGNQGAEQ